MNDLISTVGFVVCACGGIALTLATIWLAVMVAQWVIIDYLLKWFRRFSVGTPIDIHFEGKKLHKFGPTWAYGHLGNNIGIWLVFFRKPTPSKEDE